MRMGGKVTIVTGAGSGIGRATANLFATEGAKVVVADVEPSSGRETVQEISKTGGTAVQVVVDVSKADEVKTMIKTCITNFGKLDVLFNNAGIEGRARAIGISRLYESSSIFRLERRNNRVDKITGITVCSLWNPS